MNVNNNECILREQGTRVRLVALVLLFVSCYILQIVNAFVVHNKGRLDKHKPAICGEYTRFATSPVALFVLQPQKRFEFATTDAIY